MRKHKNSGFTAYLLSGALAVSTLLSGASVTAFASETAGTQVYVHANGYDETSGLWYYNDSVFSTEAAYLTCISSAAEHANGYDEEEGVWYYYDTAFNTEAEYQAYVSHVAEVLNPASGEEDTAAETEGEANSVSTLSTGTVSASASYAAAAAEGGSDSTEGSTSDTGGGSGSSDTGGGSSGSGESSGSGDESGSGDSSAGTTAPSDEGSTAPSDAGTVDPNASTGSDDSGTSDTVDPTAGTTEPSDAGTTEPSDAGTTEPSDAGTTDPGSSSSSSSSSSCRPPYPQQQPPQQPQQPQAPVKNTGNGTAMVLADVSALPELFANGAAYVVNSSGYVTFQSISPEGWAYYIWDNGVVTAAFAVVDQNNTALTLSGISLLNVGDETYLNLTIYSGTAFTVAASTQTKTLIRILYGLDGVAVNGTVLETFP